MVYSHFWKNQQQHNKNKNRTKCNCCLEYAETRAFFFCLITTSTGTEENCEGRLWTPKLKLENVVQPLGSPSLLNLCLVWFFSLISNYHIKIFFDSYIFVQYKIPTSYSPFWLEKNADEVIKYLLWCLLWVHFFTIYMFTFLLIYNLNHKKTENWIRRNWLKKY